MKKIFICTSFSTKIDGNGSITKEYKQELELILSAIRTANLDYFCAVESAGWRMENSDDATAEFKNDLEQIDQADALLALLDTEPSVGVQTEIGYFLKELESNPHKRLVLAHASSRALAWSNRAISKLPGVIDLAYQTPEDIVDCIVTQSS